MRLALVDLSALFVPAWKAIPSSEPASAPHDAVVSRVRRLAERTGAAIATLPDEGHFWMLESPERVAAIITDFWATV